MEYVEKELPVEQMEEPEDPLNLEVIAKLPVSHIEHFLKENIEKIRAGMGGDSKDITTRSITSEDKIISGYENDLRIRIYKPEISNKRPLMVFFHGGGWFGGSLEAVENYCKGVCDQADCVVISVDYHLTPEHPYPEGVEDSYLAVKWAIKNKSELNIDENKIVVSGDSAGGNFSAVLTLMAKDRKEYNIAKQILIYPATNLEVHSNPNETSPGSDGVDKFLQAIINLYLQGHVDSSDPYVSPALAKDFNNLPEALIAVGEQDPLYKSCLEYAKILDKAGKYVKFILYKNTDHAFIDRTGNSDQADDLVKEAAEFIRN
ncbi:MAG: alpha/beta hydrolase [Candidatus Lokiarchaeota archaeon]|nr:alpha/beta hydrolase [Candidatus Lokiarchaeota archaeon]